ncbi:hypothetical protein GOP47_0024915 [Adiantum capillus-veneris]|uniref:Uncharacterized protein n=1 Tax=Adiantum capillus-veneris TaxID=13818 RepID=A0A9D4U3Q4_ADICA|nr:hypothetical protein GOP47_0024915 [Adiantum capillus-veneris]
MKVFLMLHVHVSKDAATPANDVDDPHLVIKHPVAAEIKAIKPDDQVSLSFANFERKYDASSLLADALICCLVKAIQLYWSAHCLKPCKPLMALDPKRFEPAIAQLHADVQPQSMANTCREADLLLDNEPAVDAEDEKGDEVTAPATDENVDVPAQEADENAAEIPESHQIDGDEVPARNDAAKNDILATEITPAAPNHAMLATLPYEYCGHHADDEEDEVITNFLASLEEEHTNFDLQTATSEHLKGSTLFGDHPMINEPGDGEEIVVASSCMYQTQVDDAEPADDGEIDPTLMEIIRRVPHPYNMDVAHAFHVVPKCKYCCGGYHNHCSNSCRPVKIQSRKHEDPFNDGAALACGYNFNLIAIDNASLVSLTYLLAAECMRLAQLIIFAGSCRVRKGRINVDLHPRHSKISHECLMHLKPRWKMKPQHRIMTFNNFLIDPG